jgi:hypothetical protein
MFVVLVMKMSGFIFSRKLIFQVFHLEKISIFHFPPRNRRADKNLHKPLSALRAESKTAELAHSPGAPLLLLEISEHKTMATSSLGA